MCVFMYINTYMYICISLFDPVLIFFFLVSDRFLKSELLFLSTVYGIISISLKAKTDSDR